MHQGQTLNFQNTFDRACDDITRKKIQTENFFGSLISMRLEETIHGGYTIGMQLSRSVSNEFIRM
jgi:hypothetical protein